MNTLKVTYKGNICSWRIYALIGGNTILIKLLLKIAFSLILVSFAMLNLTGQVITRAEAITLDPLKPIIIKKIQPLDSNKLSDLQVIDQIVGCICDPVIVDEFGILILGSFNTPNIGLGLNLNPLFWKHIKTDILYRDNFHQNYILNSGIETKYLFRKHKIDLRFEYNNYNIESVELINYRTFTVGGIYRIPWSSIGFQFGHDNNHFQDKYGFDVWLKYTLHYATGECCNSHRSFAIVSNKLGYWDNNINYIIKVDFLLNSPFDIGIGYERIFKYNDLFVTFKYSIYY